MLTNCWLRQSEVESRPASGSERGIVGNYGCINKVINGGNVVLRSYQDYLCNLNILNMTFNLGRENIQKYRTKCKYMWNISWLHYSMIKAHKTLIYKHPCLLLNVGLGGNDIENGCSSNHQRG